MKQKNLGESSIGGPEEDHKVEWLRGKVGQGR